MGWKWTNVLGVPAALACAAGLAWGAASWVGQPYGLTIPTHITQSGQAVVGSVDLLFDHDAPCMLSVSVAGNGDEVLTRGTATLTTSYRLTGANLANGDADWVDSTTFLSQTYNVLGSATPDTITLWVRAAAPAGQAPEAGNYTASIILTASW